jgi:hypothetical protein
MCKEGFRRRKRGKRMELRWARRGVLPCSQARGGEREERRRSYGRGSVSTTSSGSGGGKDELDGFDSCFPPRRPLPLPDQATVTLSQALRALLLLLLLALRKLRLSLVADLALREVELKKLAGDALVRRVIRDGELGEVGLVRESVLWVELSREREVSFCFEWVAPPLHPIALLLFDDLRGSVCHLALITGWKDSIGIPGGRATVSK